MEDYEYDYLISKPELDENLLMHYGIKGMRWGHRKQRPVSLGSRRRHYGVTTLDKARNIARGSKDIGTFTKNTLKRSGRFYAKTGKSIAKSYVDRYNSAKTGAKAIGKVSKKLYDGSKDFTERWKPGVTTLDKAKNAARGAKIVGKGLAKPYIDRYKNISETAKKAGKGLSYINSKRIERAANASARDAQDLRKHGYTKEADAVQQVSDKLKKKKRGK